METIVLASGSPQRSALLAQIRLPFLTLAPEIEEAADGASPEEFARNVARDKAAAIFDRIVAGIDLARRDAASEESLVLSRIHNAANVWILGADTLIDIDGRMLGKPRDAESAREMIEALSGREHEVITGLCLLLWRNREGSPVETIESDKTTVRFAALGQTEIDRYVGSGDWKGAAGAYRIQSLGATLVEAIVGSYSNVVGLPLRRFCGMLQAHGYYG